VINWGNLNYATLNKCTNHGENCEQRCFRHLIDFNHFIQIK